MDWLQIKDEVTASTGLERDALHVYGGTLGVLVFACLLRRSVAHLLTWLLVFGVELGNEAMNMTGDRLGGQWEWDGARHDLWNTMLSRTNLLLAACFVPDLFVPPASFAEEQRAQ